MRAFFMKFRHPFLLCDTLSFLCAGHNNVVLNIKIYINYSIDIYLPQFS